jgi:hypothetical protein
MKHLFLLALLAFGQQGTAQKTTDKLNFEKGKKLEMIAETKAVITQDVMGQSMDMNVASMLVRSFDIEDVKNGTATIEHKVKRLTFDFDVMGQSQSFDSEKEEDLKSEMGKSLEKTIKNKYSMVVDPAGTIVSVKADDDNKNDSAANTNDVMGNMMSQFAEGLEIPKTGETIPLKVPTSGALKKGQSWTDSLQGEEQGSVKYTVVDVTSADVLIDYISEGVTKRSQDLGTGMTMEIDLTNKTTGKITLDKKTGLLKKRTIESEGIGNMEIAGQSIPMKSKVTGTITVNGL